MLSLYKKRHVTGVVLREDGNNKLDYLNQTLLSSRFFEKATYVSWIRYFSIQKGNDSSYVVKALLAHWLSWFVLFSSSTDGLSSFLFLWQFC